MTHINLPYYVPNTPHQAAPAGCRPYTVIDEIARLERRVAELERQLGLYKAPLPLSGGAVQGSTHVSTCNITQQTVNRE